MKFDSKGFLDTIERMMNGADEKSMDSDDSSLDDYESDDSVTEETQTEHTAPNTQPDHSKPRSSGGRVAKVPPPPSRKSVLSSTKATDKANSE